MKREIVASYALVDLDTLLVTDVPEPISDDLCMPPKPLEMLETIQLGTTTAGDSERILLAEDYLETAIAQ